jgi:hypothetical protein
MRRLFSMQVWVAAISRLWNTSWIVNLVPRVNLVLDLGRSLEWCCSVLVIPDSGRLQSMCCRDAFVTNKIYFGFESQCLTTNSSIIARCFRGTWTDVESEDYRDSPCNCPGRGCCYGNVCCKAFIVYKVTVLAHWQLLHWCNVADIEKVGSGSSAECPPVPEKWSLQ